MGREGNLKITKDKQSGCWVVNVSAKLSDSGKRQRKFFSKKAEAEAFRNKLKEHNQSGASVEYDPELLSDASYFRDLFSLYDLSFKEACAEFSQILEKRYTSSDLGTVMQSYRTIHSGNWSEGMLRLVRWSEKQLLLLKSRNVTELDIDFWLEWLPIWKENGDYSPTSYNHLKSYISSLYGLPEMIKLYPTNPMAAVPSLRVKQREVSVLTPAETSLLLQSAQELDPEIVPWFAVAIFAGLRPQSELDKLDWTDINFEENWIRIAFGNKTDTKRFVDLNTTLKTWLTPYKKESGKLILTNQRKRKDRIIKHAGITWGRDITRHTYGSYLEAKIRSEGGDARAEVSSNMGHTNYKTYEQHYRNTRSPKEAKAFWGIQLVL